MPKRSVEPTPAEFNVLQALWALQKGTVAEVRQQCARDSGAEAAYTTIMTLLNRLEAKRLVRADKSREPFVYQPTRKPSVVVRSRVRQLVDSVFAGNMNELILQLLDDERLSKEDLKRIEEKIASKERRP